MLKNNPEIRRSDPFTASLVVSVLVLFSIFLPVISIWSQIPAGYYATAAGKSGQTLQIALYNIIKGHNVINYTPGVWNAFYTTDLKANGSIWDMYSDIPGGTPPYVYWPGPDQCGSGGGGTEGDCYSREHSFPKSWFDDLAPMNTDLFHIVPTDQYVNNMHSNYPYAVVGSASFISLNGSKKGTCSTPGYSGTVFEPVDAYKGDFARTYFYMATRYQNVISTWQDNDPNADAVLDGTSYPAFEPWYLSLLIAWHTQDPVSAKEIARNDSIYKLQLNRNPFIDHPEYVSAVWQPSGPKPEPSGHVTDFIAFTGNPPYNTIRFTWTDATGTVLPDGYLIRGGTAGYGSIVNPTDGVPVPDGTLDKNVSSGIQTVDITGLEANTVYYFRIFPFTNSGTQINFKTDGVVPSDTALTTPGVSTLQPGDIAIIEAGSTDPDRISFITFRQLSAGTIIRFTDNGFVNPTTVRTGEGFLTYAAPFVIPAGTIISWHNGMNIYGTGWSSATPGNFLLSVAGDQVFAYQGTWGVDQVMICGVQTGNAAWLTSGTATSNTSYLPQGLVPHLTALTFPEANGNFNLIGQSSAGALLSLAGYYTNWIRSSAALPTPSWNITLDPHTIVIQNATVETMTIGAGETLTIPEGIQLTVNTDLIIIP